MSSYNKTERLHLNNWAASDRPMRNDFNYDNLIIDEVVGEHIADSDIHLTAREKSRVSMPLVVDAYTGNGNAERTIALGTAPLGVIVYRVGMPPVAYDSANACNKVYTSLAFSGGQSASGITLSGNTLTVREDESATGGIKSCLNTSGAQYKIILIV